MDLIVIVIHKARVRKKVAQYLKHIGLGGYMMIHSEGTEALSNEVMNSRIDSPFDNKEDIMNFGKTIMVMNNSELETNKIIDRIHEISEINNKNTGIAFSIPITDILTSKR